MNVPTTPLPVEFNDILRKLRRAHEHAESFNRAAQEFWKSVPYAGRGDVDRKGRGLYRVSRIDPTPPDLGIFVGEAAHQLRSSLDHLMWLLAVPVPKKEGEVQFPIVNSLAEFRGRKSTKAQPRGFRGTRHMMPGVARGVRTLIEGLQPYHRRSWPATALLAQVRAISNWDKHRTLATVGAGVMVAEPVFRSTGKAVIKNVEVFRPVLKPNAILLRWEVAYAERGTKVQVKPVTTVVPQFDERMPKEIRGRPVFEVLDNAANFIELTVLPMFAGFF